MRLDNDELGNAKFGNRSGFDLIRLETIWNGWILVGVDDVDVGDRAK
jgi:hypothetical protein